MTCAIACMASNVISAQSPAPPTQVAELVGGWQQTHAMYDENGNRKIDEDERRKARSDAGMALFDMRLNADGSCRLKSTKCRYEVQAQSGGRQRLMLFVETNNRESRENLGIIHSVTKDELILANYGSGSFNVYKRTAR